MYICIRSTALGPAVQLLVKRVTWVARTWVGFGVQKEGAISVGESVVAMNGGNRPAAHHESSREKERQGTVVLYSGQRIEDSDRVRRLSRMRRRSACYEGAVCITKDVFVWSVLCLRRARLEQR